MTEKTDVLDGLENRVCNCIKFNAYYSFPLPRTVDTKYCGLLLQDEEGSKCLFAEEYKLRDIGIGEFEILLNVHTCNYNNDEEIIK